MGIFDNFKSSNSSSIDLSNNAIKRMVEWIAHPMEFDKEPESAVIFDERNLFWHTNQTEYCSLIKFVVDKEEYIGITGPITWCFIGVDFNKMTIDNLYETYCGWHIVFASINSKDYDKKMEGINEMLIIEKLSSENFKVLKKLQNVFIGGNNYYEFLAEKDGNKIKLVGTENEMIEYSIAHILPFYEYVGIGWNPLDK